jgi:hypothetical protein
MHSEGIHGLNKVNGAGRGCFHCKQSRGRQRRKVLDLND